MSLEYGLIAAFLLLVVVPPPGLISTMSNVSGTCAVTLPPPYPLRHQLHATLLHCIWFPRKSGRAHHAQQSAVYVKFLHRTQVVRTLKRALPKQPAATPARV